MQTRTNYSIISILSSLRRIYSVKTALSSGLAPVCRRQGPSIAWVISMVDVQLEIMWQRKFVYLKENLKKTKDFFSCKWKARMNVGYAKLYFLLFCRSVFKINKRLIESIFYHQVSPGRIGSPQTHLASTHFSLGLVTSTVLCSIHLNCRAEKNFFL